MDFSASIDAYKESIIQDIQRLVKIKSVDDTPRPGMPFGEGIGRALDEALKISEELGFAAHNLDGYAGYAEAGQGEEVVGILVHLDVVPEGLGWKYEPYGAEISENKIYGRGTSDDKAPAVVSLYALKAVADSGAAFKKRVRIIFGTNEEKGSE
ncbi:MAG: M20/M25/M40 family metallo-hydrolase, partial [Eubacteriaceae bacterium]|nr:M20/M25/M40 family metallo-hydrolase [Eubacteriaceae bacterium]